MGGVGRTQNTKPYCRVNNILIVKEDFTIFNSKSIEGNID